MLRYSPTSQAPPAYSISDESDLPVLIRLLMIAGNSKPWSPRDSSGASKRTFSVATRFPNQLKTFAYAATTCLLLRATPPAAVRAITALTVSRAAAMIALDRQVVGAIGCSSQPSPHHLEACVASVLHVSDDNTPFRSKPGKTHKSSPFRISAFEALPYQQPR